MTTTRTLHCSTFALDAHWAARRSPEPELVTHLAQCVRCRAYLAELEAIDARRPAAPRPLTPERRRWAPSLATGAGVLAVAAGALLFLGRARDANVGGYVGVKGTPSVQLIVHRGQTTGIWDGRAPIRPGDVLALRVACEGLSRVAVAAPGGPGAAWTRLKDVDCPPDAAAPLPFTLVVDDEPVNERFAVVLSREPLEDAALASAAASTARTADVWAVRFDLAKLTELQ